jgi:hypothetical protein
MVRETRDDHTGQARHAGKTITNSGKYVSCHRILSNNDVLVRIKFFPRFDGAEYIAVVGRMKQFHADQYRRIRGGPEAKKAGGLPLTIPACTIPNRAGNAREIRSLGHPPRSYWH